MNGLVDVHHQLWLADSFSWVSLGEAVQCFSKRITTGIWSRTHLHCTVFLCFCLGAKSRPTLLWPFCSLPGSPVHGISQAGILEWVAIFFSRGFSWPRDWTWVSCISRQILYPWAIREATREALCSYPMWNIEHSWFPPTKCQGHSPISAMTKTVPQHFQSPRRNGGGGGGGGGDPLWLGNSTIAIISSPDPSCLRGSLQKGQAFFLHEVLDDRFQSEC